MPYNHFQQTIPSTIQSLSTHDNKYHTITFNTRYQVTYNHFQQMIPSTIQSLSTDHYWVITILSSILTISLHEPIEEFIPADIWSNSSHFLQKRKHAAYNIFRISIAMYHLQIKPTHIAWRLPSQSSLLSYMSCEHTAKEPLFRSCCVHLCRRHLYSCIMKGESTSISLVPLVMKTFHCTANFQLLCHHELLKYSYWYKGLHCRYICFLSQKNITFISFF